MLLGITGDHTTLGQRSLNMGQGIAKDPNHRPWVGGGDLQSNIIHINPGGNLGRAKVTQKGSKQVNGKPTPSNKAGVTAAWIGAGPVQ